MTGRHRAPRLRGYSFTRLINGHPIRLVLRCSWYAPGFCPASVDGYCVGGTTDKRCLG